VKIVLTENCVIPKKRNKSSLQTLQLFVAEISLISLRIIFKMPNLAMIGDRASCEYYDDSLERDSETPSAAQEEKGLLPRRDDSQLGGGNRKLYSIIRSLPLILSVLFFIAGISVWGNVLLLVKNFHCGTLPAKDNFEPDCQSSKIFSVIAETFTICLQLNSGLFKPSHIPTPSFLRRTTIKCYK